jgi:hypothetical protein
MRYEQLKAVLDQPIKLIHIIGYFLRVLSVSNV